MDWHDLEKMTVVKLREEAANHSELKGVHGMKKPELVEALAKIMGIEKPHAHYSDEVVHTKEALKQRIRALKGQREGLIAARDRKSLHTLRREIHRLKRRIKKIEMSARH